MAIEKTKSAYGHGEGADGKRKPIGKATNLWGPGKTPSRVLIHGNREKNIIDPWKRGEMKRGPASGLHRGITGGGISRLNTTHSVFSLVSMIQYTS